MSIIYDTKVTITKFAIMQELFFIIGFLLFSGTSVFGHGLDVEISEEKKEKLLS